MTRSFTIDAEQARALWYFLILLGQVPKGMDELDFVYWVNTMEIYRR